MAGVGIQAATSLRHPHGRASALVAGVGHGGHLGRVDGVEDAVMRRRKSWYYEREPRPGISVIGARLSELVRR